MAGSTRSWPLVITLLVAAGACSTELEEPGRAPATTTDHAVVAPPDILNYPCDSDTAVGNMGGLAPATTGGTSHSHEVHDCQKLVMPGQTRTFGPLVGLWPVKTTMDADAPTYFAPGRVAVQIVNYDQTLGYSPLGLEPRKIHCLMLRYDQGGTPATRWSAWIATPADPDQSCLTADDDDLITLYTDLEVRLWRGPRGGPHFPTKTARWHWGNTPHGSIPGGSSPGGGTEELRNEHYIGLKCANDWCSVGRTGFAATTTQLNGSDARLVPGRYDEQFLAVPDPSDSNKLVPGPWAVVFPAHNFPDLDTPGHFDTYTEIAHVRFLPDNPAQEAHYKHRLKFTKTDPQSDTADENTISLRRVGSSNTEFEFRHESADNSDQGQWGAEEIPHVKHGAYGSVRWRWIDDDETIWASCPVGCCESRGTL